MAEPKKKKSSAAKTRVTTSTTAGGSKKPKTSAKASVKAVESKPTKKTEEAKATSSKATTKTKSAKATETKPVVKATSEKKTKNDTKKNKSSKKDNGPKKTSYVKGAWHELKHVRWPNRTNTWQMTIAVIIFSLLLAGIVLLLDFFFQYLFNRIILQG